MYVVAFSTILIAGTLKYVCDWAFLKISLDPTYHSEHPSVKESLHKNSKSADDLKNSLLDEEIKEYKKFNSKSQRFFQNFDEKYLKPFLIYDYENRKEEIKLKKKIDRKVEHLKEHQHEEAKYERAKTISGSDEH
jgi:sodium/hydrogen exchanger-like protein 6/7/sodium/hydrogen exchanger 8